MKYRPYESHKGDYAGPLVVNRKALFEAMLGNISNAATIEERDHARVQIGWALACRSLNSEQATLLFVAAGLSAEGGLLPEK